MGWDWVWLRDQKDFMGRIRWKWLPLVLHQPHQIVWSRKFQSKTSWSSDRKSKQSLKSSDTKFSGDRLCSTWQLTKNSSNSFSNFSTYGTSTGFKNQRTSQGLQRRRCSTFLIIHSRIDWWQRQRLKDEELMDCIQIWKIHCKLFHQSCKRVTEIWLKAHNTSINRDFTWLCCI